MLQRYLLALITACLVVGLDLSTKFYWFGRAVMWMKLYPVLATVQHRNYGLIFNLPAPTWVIVGVSGLVLLIVLALFIRKIHHFQIALALGFLVGGAVGNGYDRVMLGFVRDWVLAFGRSAFNVADVAIGIGLVLLICSHSKKVDGVI